MELAPAGLFNYAEPYHQQYLARNPNGYCGSAARVRAQSTQASRPSSGLRLRLDRGGDRTAHRAVGRHALGARDLGRDVDGITETTITNSATTFTTGCSIGWKRFAKIQIGSVCWAPAVKIVTTTSSTRGRRRAARPRAAHCAAGEGDMVNVCHRSPPRSFDASSRLPWSAPQAGHCVVEDDHDAEGRVPDDDRRQAVGEPGS